jgi:hypothetical protein
MDEAELSGVDLAEAIARLEMANVYQQKMRKALAERYFVSSESFRKY